MCVCVARGSAAAAAVPIIFRLQEGLSKGIEPEEPCRGYLTKCWQPVVLQLMEQLVSGLGMPRGFVATEAGEVFTAAYRSTGGCGIKVSFSVPFSNICVVFPSG